ncbi:hypothetical protein [Antribacter gilvus]|uniref:hypothetical protein n=1 Tax=Antribacter gilvus TaxID=2304675 RepID=UPI000F7A0E91|nr:hypothetical protein [Antribacter gilvus]
MGVRGTDQALGVPATLRRVGTEEDARALAAALQRTGRAWPVVVISTPAGRDAPWVDPRRVLDEVSGLAEVVVIPTGDVSWEFSRHMPDHTQVYGGASRVYGVELDWVRTPSRSQLHFAYSATDGARVHERLVRDALTSAVRAGLAGSAGPVPPGAREARGTVLGVLGSRAIVALDDGGQAGISEELTVPGVPLDRLLAPGMSVTGAFDQARKLLDVRAMLPDAATQRRAVKRAYRVGHVVLGRVESVDDAAVTIALAPAVAVRVHRSEVTGNDLDLLGDLFSVGEVVLGRVAPAPLDGVALRLDDVDEGEPPLPALSLLDGGPPWLGLPRPAPVVPAADTVAELSPLPAAPRPGPALLPGPSPRPGAPGTAALPARGSVTSAPGPGSVVGHRRPTPGDVAAMLAGESAAPAPPAHQHASGKAARDLSLALDAERARSGAFEREVAHLRRAHRQGEVELEGLRTHVAELQDRLARRELHVEQQKTELRKARTESASLRRRLGELGGVDDGDERLFLDPEEQFRFEVGDAWAHVVRAAEKAARPLAPYRLGPRFLGSVDDIEGVSRERLLWTVVMVLTGLAHEMNGLQVHRLRTGAGGDDPTRVRESDGAVCWRVSLQVNTPSARRLHYWRVPGAGYELSRVVLHDDVEP